MGDSYQTFPSMTARFLRTLDPSDANNRNENIEQKHDDRMTIEGFFFINIPTFLFQTIFRIEYIDFFCVQIIRYMLLPQKAIRGIVIFRLVKIT